MFDLGAVQLPNTCTMEWCRYHGTCRARTSDVVVRSCMAPGRTRGETAKSNTTSPLHRPTPYRFAHRSTHVVLDCQTLLLWECVGLCKTSPWHGASSIPIGWRQGRDSASEHADATTVAQPPRTISANMKVRESAVFCRGGTE